MVTTDKTRTAGTAESSRKTNAHLRKARLSPDSRDPEARAIANSPDLAAALGEARRSGTLSDAEFQARNPLTPEEETGGDALLEDWLAQDEAAGVRDEPDA